MIKIHPTAIVSPKAQLDSNVEIGPYTIIDKSTSIGTNTKIGSHVTIIGHTTIGKNNNIFPYAAIGFAPQDITYKNEPTQVIIGDKIFSLNIRHSIQANAERYYSQSKKAEKKLSGAKKQLQQTLTKIKEVKKRLILKTADQRPVIKKRKKGWFEKFRWIHSSDGFLVIGGRDAKTNELLVKKHMAPDDIVFHAEITGAPFVLIKTEGKNVPEQTLNEAAQLAASYSRAWKEMLSSINVYWVLPEQLSKSPPTGQYLQKGSFIIRGSKNFVRDVPLHVAIGLKIGEQIRVIGGSVDAINNQTEVVVEIVPGDQKSSQLAKKIRHLLSTKVADDLKRTVTSISIEEFQRFIPLGRGKIKS